MEAISCVKAVILAASQYKNNRTDDSVLHLHRHLDVLISITNKGSSLAFLHPKQLLSTECIACLVEIMNDPQTKAALAHKTMTLFNNLANASFLLEFFRSTFDVTAILISYIRGCLSQPVDENVVLCIRLLQKLTYKSKTSAQQCYVEELVNFLIHQIVETAENKLTSCCLGLLANLCRTNAFVKTYIKNRENCKAVFKKLMAYFSHRSQKVEIFAISIVCSLCLEEEVGKRIFRDQNIHQVFQLLFNIVHNGEQGMTQQYAVDLFIDIIQFEKFQNLLIRYDHLSHCLQQILHVLTSAEATSSATILEMLVGFCQVTELRRVVCHLLLESMTPQNSNVELSQLSSNRQNLPPLFAVVFWAAQPTDCPESVHLFALELLHHLHQAVFSDGLAVEKIVLSLRIVVTTLQEILAFSVSPDSIYAKQHLQRKLNAATLLKTLCENGITSKNVTSQFDLRLLPLIVEHQQATNAIGLNSNFSSQSSSDDVNDCSEVGLDLMLVVLEVLLVVCNKNSQYKSSLINLMKDSRLVPLLAYSLTSQSRERIQRALHLAFAAVNIAAFDISLLADNMSWLNCSVRSPVSTTGLRLSTSHSQSGALNSFSSISSGFTSSSSFSNETGQTSHASLSDLDTSVQNLILKMQSGLKVKDIRSSELIALYEHRLQSLQMKENSLQDLLEAKTATLLQSDRLLTQFRLRIVQYEAEGHKLRSLLQESERCKEDLEEKQESLMAKYEILNAELEQLGLENNRLEEVSEKYQHLTQNYVEQSQKLDSCQRMLNTLKQEHESLVEVHEMLKRHYETLRLQHDKATKHLLDLEDEKNGLATQLKEKESKVSDLSRSLQKTEESLKKRTTDCDELEVAIDKLRAELAKTEQSKKELNHQVSSLEVVCRQREASIKEKDNLIGQQKAELEKHSQIAALIHSLSGGKAPPTSF